MWMASHARMSFHIPQEKDHHHPNTRNKEEEHKEGKTPPIKKTASPVKIPKSTTKVQQLKQKQRRLSRPKMGWSFKAVGGDTGPLPKCKSCNHAIERQEPVSVTITKNKFQSAWRHSGFPMTFVDCFVFVGFEM